jgi:hypothetical protein
MASVMGGPPLLANPSPCIKTFYATRLLIMSISEIKKLTYKVLSLVCKIATRWMIRPRLEHHVVRGG